MLKHRLTMAFAVFCIISLLAYCLASTDHDHSVNAQQEQALYFQSESSDYYYIYYNRTFAMNTNMPSSQSINWSLSSGLAFVSPPLTEQFTFPYYVGITIYHEQVPHRGSEILLWTLGWITATGQQVAYSSDSYTMKYDTTSTTISAHFDAVLLKGERLFVELSLDQYSSSSLDMYWGNSSFLSRVSYQGSALYVPEFPTLLPFAMFIPATLISIIVYKKKGMKTGQS